LVKKKKEDTMGHILIHKKRDKSEQNKRVSWCGIETGIVSGRWTECTCYECFKEAIHGKTKNQWNITGTTRLTAMERLRENIKNNSLVLTMERK
jgi:hypothetical protein